ncbi:MAG TPA: hypothetical protein VGY13_03310 [Solirubrobacteraceae bacterium]|nr:hypothetical protein [Solirubrobacteraceae bacterium]
MRTAALALVALALAASLTACESSQEENARIEREVAHERVANLRRRALAERNRTIAHPSAIVKVLAASVLHTSEGAAAVVTLRNDSASALSNLPIQIVVRDAAGASVYTNAVPGLGASLTTVAQIGAHATVLWVDDQVQASSTPASVSAKVGEGERGKAASTAALAVSGVHLSEGGAEGSLVNHGSAAQHEVILDAVARRGGTIVAAGGALVSDVEAGASAHFQALLIGRPQGAQLEVSVAGSATASG